MQTSKTNEEMDSSELRDTMEQQPPNVSPYAPFLPEHAETARLTEKALRSAITGLVSCLLARIESSVEASVWRGVQAASSRPPRSPTPRPPPPGNKIDKQDGKRGRRTLAADLSEHSAAPPPAKRSRKTKKPKPVDNSQFGQDGGSRGVSFEDNSQSILDESAMSADFLAELASQL